VPIICPPFIAPENSVVVPLNGADPANLKLGDEVEFTCNSGYVYRSKPGDPEDLTNRTKCMREPACTWRPTKTCVLKTVSTQIFYYIMTFSTQNVSLFIKIATTHAGCGWSTKKKEIFVHLLKSVPFIFGSFVRCL